jgi:hypothetical protein
MLDEKLSHPIRGLDAVQAMSLVGLAGLMGIPNNE